MIAHFPVWTIFKSRNSPLLLCNILFSKAKSFIPRASNFSHQQMTAKYLSLGSTIPVAYFAPLLMFWYFKDTKNSKQNKSQFFPPTRAGLYATYFLSSCTNIYWLMQELSLLHTQPFTVSPTSRISVLPVMYLLTC